MGDSNAQNM